MGQRNLSSLIPTTLFVVLWSSGTIFSEVGLQHGSPFALLVVRYAIALLLLSCFALWKRHWLPQAGSRKRVALIGLLVGGVYSSCYMLALDHDVTPGVLATIVGVQPILTLFLMGEKPTIWRIGGLLCALAGLAIVVFDGFASLQFSWSGLLFAILALLGITAGSILQKQETQAPWVVLPLQYAVGLAFTLMLVPFGPFEMTATAGFIIPALWLAVVISVGATFLLYGLIARGNLVNVTSLLYLVPGVTALMDWLFLGNAMQPLAIAGLALVVIGLTLVFKKTAQAEPAIPS